MFALVSVTMLRLQAVRRPMSSYPRSYLSVALPSLLLATGIEVVQPFIGRDGSAKDVVTHLLGSTAALARASLDEGSGGRSWAEYRTLVVYLVNPQETTALLRLRARDRQDNQELNIGGSSFFVPQNLRSETFIHAASGWSKTA